MKLKVAYVFYVQAIALLITSLLWIFAPGAFYESGGLSTTDPGWLLFGRNTGALLFGLAPIAFFAGRSPDSPLRRQLLLSFFLLHLVSFLIYAIVLVTTQVSFGPAIYLHIVFGLAFGYFQFFQSGMAGISEGGGKS